MTQYQVVGQVAHVRSRTPQGWMTQLLYRGSLLPEDVPAEQIRHLLAVKLIAPFGPGGSDLPGAAVPPPVSGQAPSNAAPAAEQAPATAPEDNPDRVAARAELPADGSLPKPAQPKAVWVEAAVARGFAYEAAVGTSKAELMELLKSK